MDSTVWLFTIISACAATLQQSDLNYIGDNLDIRITVHNDIRKNNDAKHRFSLTMTNTGSKTIQRDNWEIYFYSFFRIEPGNLPSKDGYILPNYKVKFSQINGCLFSMAPTVEFPDIAPNGSHFVEFHAQWWTVTRTDVPPNWYVTSPTLDPVNIKSTATGKRFVTDYDTVDQWKRYLVDQYNPFTAQDRYRRYEFRDFNTHTKLVIPTPKDIRVNSDRFINIKDKKVVCTPEAKQSCLTLKEKLGLELTINNDTSQERNCIRLWINSSLGENAGLYHLFTDIEDETLTVIGQSPVAVYYGIQSLLSLVSGSPNQVSVPDVSIKDEPRFEHRGMHVDLSRNFRTKADILRLMEAMSMFKMNKLHLHLSDDEGWRLEIPGIPELTEVGGRRCHDLEEKTCLIPQLGSGGDSSTSGSGHLRVADFREILIEATKRFIQVIPEIDMPGHSHAAIVSMEARYHKYKTTNPTLAMQYRLRDPDDTSKYESVQMFNDNAINPCIESTYAFVEKVVSEIKKMYEGHQQFKVFHFGGDEMATNAWVNSSKCQQFEKENPFYNTTHRLKEYFALRVANITHKLGANFAGWEDGLLDEDGLPFERILLPNSIVYANAWQNIWEWGVGRRAYDLANSGYKVVLSHATHLFFDQPQEPDPEEAGLYWATRFTDAKKTFHFLPDRLYDNIEVSRSGERLTKEGICGENMEKCPPLENKTNIIGLQGQSWGETFMTSEVFDSMVFPRMLALAERAWHKASWEEKDNPSTDEAAYKDWESFANTVGHKELERLRQLGIQYRISPPGAIVDHGYLKVNTEFPGHVVQYSQDGGNVWKDFPPEWFLLGQQALLMRSCIRNKTRCSREITFYSDEPAAISDQHLVDYIAKNIQPTYQVVSNLVNDWHNFTIRITLTNAGSRDLSYGNWEMYFNSIRLLQPNDFPYPKGFVLNDCNLILHHVSGSLFKLKPSPSFQLNKTRSVSCIVVAKYWQSAITDSMPNWYVTAEAMKAKNMQSTQDESLEFIRSFDRREQYLRYPEDKWQPYSAQVRFDINEAMTIPGSSQKRIIPTPVEESFRQETVSIDSTWVVVNSTEYFKEIQLISGILNLSITKNKPTSKYIAIITDNNIDPLNKEATKDEAYIVNISASSISISVRKSAGAFYAYQTLYSLKGSNNVFPIGIIKDQPRFAYRGMHVDVGRNFHSKEEILKILDAMAMYKLNKFHFHLTEDEGWRLEIPGLPELTEVGSKRCHDPMEEECLLPQLGSGSEDCKLGCGFYTIEDYKEILRHANDRHIEVIPEIDMPGHCRAGIKAMEARFRKYMKYGNETAAREFLMTDFDDNSEYLSVQMFTDNAINVCMNSTTAFIRYIIKALKDMHKEIQPLRVYHFGGDELGGAWKDSPECKMFLTTSGLKVGDLKRYFAHLLSELTSEEELNVAAWGDGLKEGLLPFNRTEFPGKGDVLAYNWENVWEWGQGDKAYKLANAGYKVVLGHATHLYFDHPYEPDPEERGFYWATRFTDTRKVFGYIPSDIYKNADKAGNGNPLTQDQICTHNGSCLQLEKPENIIGIQGHIWTETVRTAEQLQEMVFPRLVALAERAWHRSAWEDIENKDERIRKTNEEWTSFADALGHRELDRLEEMGIKYHLPKPGARIITGINDIKLEVNTAFPGVMVEYTEKGRSRWKSVTSETTIPPGTDIELRTKSKSGRVRSFYRTHVTIRSPSLTSASIRKSPKMEAFVTSFVFTFLSNMLIA